MIKLKEAVVKAQIHLAEVIPDAAKLLVEETEFQKARDGNFWLITLSFESKAVHDTSNILSIGFITSRTYKEFKVDAESGDVVSMKIRTFKNNDE